MSHARRPLIYAVFAALSLLVTVQAAAPPAASALDTGLSVVARGTVASTPTGAWEPAVTKAPNGDLLVAFPTTTDSAALGKLMLTRSTDGGVTWNTPQLLYRPHVYVDGAVGMSVGMTTLRDGTIVLPFGETKTISTNNREGVLYFARSTDNGVTWSGLDRPITLPQPIREPFQYGKVLELADGTLLMPTWGSLRLTADWQKNPEPWRSGVLRSTDGGTTWSSYSTIAFDPNVPFDSSLPGGPNETSISQLRDGRLLAVIRYLNPLDRLAGIATPRRLYESYSSDGGLTWSTARATTLDAQSPSLTQTPCSPSLNGTTTKLALGYRINSGVNTNHGAITVSYNNGATWEGQLLLQNPSGATFWSSYPAFQDLGGGRMLVVFMGHDTQYRVFYNIVQESSTATCQAAADATAQRDLDNVTVSIQRQDLSEWTYHYGLTQKTYAAGTVVNTVVGQIGYPVGCAVNAPLQLVRVRPGRPDLVLDGTKTFAQNGVLTGDVLKVRAVTPPSAGTVIGFSDFDFYPEDGQVSNWGIACKTAQAGLDGLGRSLGIRTTIPSGQAVSSISLRSTGSTTRLRSSDYTLWVSNDNHDYTPVTGWTLDASVGTDGRLVHAFRGLSIRAPYIKIHQPYDGVTGITFILGSPHDDITVTYR